MQREIRPSRSWYTLPHAQNLKLIFEFQTPLAQNSPAGTLELIPFGSNSDLRRNCKLRRNFPAGTSELIPFGANSDLCWNCPAGTSELIPFGASSDLLWDLRFPDIPSRGFLLAFPRWGLLCLFVRGELHISPLGF